MLRETEYLIRNVSAGECSFAAYVLIAWRLGEKHSLRKGIELVTFPLL